MSDNVAPLREPKPGSEADVLARLDRWREHFGKPMAGGRANPDNDMIFLLIDAAEVIRGLRLYALKLERSAAQRQSRDRTRHRSTGDQG